MQKKVYFVLALITILRIHGTAENIQGPLTREIVLKPQIDYTKEISLSAGEFCSIRLEEDSPLLQGIQVEIVLSEKLKQYADSFALELYTNIAPPPELNMFSFTGNRVFFQILPYMNTVKLDIPYQRADSAQDTPGNYTVKKPLKPVQFPLLFTVQVILKGIPDSVLLSNFYIRFKPRLLKKGYLDLHLASTGVLDETALEIYIDDQKKDGIEFPLLLDAGIHSLLVTAPDYREKNSTFLIETGKTTSLDLELQALGASVLLDILPGTEIFLDGNKLDFTPGTELILPGGNHTFRFRIGDYSVSKTLYILEGKKYNISLFFSVDVKEN